VTHATDEALGTRYRGDEETLRRGVHERTDMTELEIEQLEEVMATLPDTCDQCGKMKPGDQLNYFADGHKLCDQCFAPNIAKPSQPKQ
jgi:hypothetical protein